jgi:hypothetical protein
MKDFIPYEQALALKEIGFDEPCFKYWVQTYNDTHTWMDVHDKALNDDDCKAPLYQQAFRWFREKYGLDCFIDRGGAKGIYYAFVGGSEHGFLYGNNRNSPSEFTYEEAELACLKKLIEIVKSKKD